MNTWEQLLTTFLGPISSRCVGNWRFFLGFGIEAMTFYAATWKIIITFAQQFVATFVSRTFHS